LTTNFHEKRPKVTLW